MPKSRKLARQADVNIKITPSILIKNLLTVSLMLRVSQPETTFPFEDQNLQ